MPQTTNSAVFLNIVQNGGRGQAHVRKKRRILRGLDGNGIKLTKFPTKCSKGGWREGQIIFEQN